MGKTAKPWLNYGLGDGRDKIVHEPKLEKKKYSTAKWLFFILGIIGAHRIYVGEYWRAFFCYIFACTVLEFITLPFKLANRFPFVFSTYVYSVVFYGALIIVAVWEFRSIQSSVKRVNKEIEAENGR